MTHEDIYEKLSDVANKYFPELVPKGWGASGPEIHKDLARNYEDYQKTPFYYKDDLEFVHWTSLNNLISIINSGEIRLYNLINSEDENEFNYAAKELELTDSRINYIKENYFTISFCTLSNLDNKYLWEQYGKTYRGVAIHFSFEKNLENWYDFFLKSVDYTLPDTFKEYQVEINKVIQNIHNSITFDFPIWKFAGFYKKQDFINEEEIRLAYITPFKNTDALISNTRKEFKIDRKRNRVVSYFPLKLWTGENSYSPVNDPEVYFKDKPIIKINNIHLGYDCGISNKEYHRFRNELIEIIDFRLGYSLNLPRNLYGNLQ